MLLKRRINFDGARTLERKRQPRIVIDFIDGDLDGEVALEGNRVAFDLYQRLARYSIDIENRSQAVNLASVCCYYG